MSERHDRMTHCAWSLALCLAACLALLAAPASTVAKGKPGGGGGGEDTTPPAPVQQLQVTSWTDETIVISWIASHDDGTEGGAATEYDIRVLADDMLGPDNWSSGRTEYCSTWGVGLPAPGPPDSLETLELTYFRPGSTYSVGVRVADEAGNWSEVSAVLFSTDASADWSVANVEWRPPSAGSNDLAVDAAGKPALVYFTSGGLRYAWLEGDTWQVEPFGPAGARSPSLAFHPTTGAPTVAYAVDGVIELARREGGAWTYETVDAWGQGQPTRSVSLAFDVADPEQPAIAWFGRKRSRGDYDDQLRLARPDGAGWSSVTVEQVGFTNMYSQCTLVFVDGQPWIGHNDTHGGVVLDSVELKRWDGQDWQSETVDELPDSSAFSGGYCRLALRPGDIPCFSYLGEGTGSGPEIRYAERSPDGTWDVTIVATNYQTVAPSLAVDASGTPAILYVSEWCDMPLQLARQQSDGSWLSTDVANMSAANHLSLEFRPGTNQAVFTGTAYWEGPLYAEQAAP